MNPIDTTRYEIIRKEDGTLKRLNGNGTEDDEMTVEYYTSQIQFHTQVILNLAAQKARVEDFEAENPLPGEDEDLESLSESL